MVRNIIIRSGRRIGKSKCIAGQEIKRQCIEAINDIDFTEEEYQDFLKECEGKTFKDILKREGGK